MRIVRISLLSVIAIVAGGASTTADRPQPLGSICAVPGDPISQGEARDACRTLARAQGYATGVLRRPADNGINFCLFEGELPHPCLGAGGGF